jgi:ABC-type Fe3+-hydroxamate transport system substrate-binding protein
MKYLILIALLLNACGNDIANESSSNDNSIINQDRRCEDCGKESVLIKDFGYEKIVCTGNRCPILPTGGIDEACDRACIEERLLLLEEAKNRCYENFNCSQAE